MKRTGTLVLLVVLMGCGAGLDARAIQGGLLGAASGALIGAGAGGGSGALIGPGSGTARRIPRRVSRRGCTILATHALATPAASTDTMVGVTTSAPTAATGTGVAGAHATIVASHGTLIASGRVGSARVNG